MLLTLSKILIPALIVWCSYDAVIDYRAGNMGMCLFNVVLVAVNLNSARQIYKFRF